jgi:hypothetical protein
MGTGKSMWYILTLAFMGLSLTSIAAPPVNESFTVEHSNSCATQTGNMRRPSFMLKKQPQANTFDNYIHTLLQPSKGGLVRGAVLGMSKAQVKRLEQPDCIKETDSTITYTIKFRNNNHMEFADIIYQFGKKGQLYSIDVDYYLDDPSTASGIYQSYLQWMSRNYGHTDINVEGFNCWETPASKGLKCLVKLKDITAPGDAGIRLSFIEAPHS